MEFNDEKLPQGANEPYIIYDSRIGADVYASPDFTYYRGELFVVPPGYVAHVEMTTRTDIYPDVMGTFVRVPAFTKLLDCDDERKYGKTYRRWRCTRSLGNNVSNNPSPSAYTPYNQSILKLGFDNLNNEISEFDYITRPGKYYILFDKRSNTAHLDANNPILVEVSLIKTDKVHDLELPCCDPCTSTPATGSDNSSM